MAKRLTDTDKWKKPFIRGLPAEYKLFWLYLLDDCDLAGIWHVDFEVANIKLGIQLSETRAQGLFAEKVVVLDNGTKWFVPDFISFQYGVLTDKNKMYNSVVAVLKKYDLMGHLSPINGGKDTNKDKDKDIKGLLGENEMTSKPKTELIPTAEAPPFYGGIVPTKTPTQQEVREFFVRSGGTIAQADRFFNHYEGLSWRKGNSPIYNWAAFANNWLAGDNSKSEPIQQQGSFTKKI